MKAQKSDNEGSQSNGSTFRPSQTKGVVRKTKSKTVKNEKQGSLAQLKSGDPIQSRPEYFLSSSEEEVQARIAKRAYELYEQ
jgi:hypothetical protein